jgi:hypothetical protein
MLEALCPTMRGIGIAGESVDKSLCKPVDSMVIHVTSGLLMLVEVRCQRTPVK